MFLNAGVSLDCIKYHRVCIFTIWQDDCIGTASILLLLDVGFKTRHILSTYQTYSAITCPCCIYT